MLTLYRRGKVWWIRGTLAGRRLHRSARTTERERADEARAALETREWKRHHYGAEAILTFSQAAARYLDAGKSDRFLRPLVSYFKNTLVREIRPGTIHQAAAELYPKGSTATRNRQAIAPAQAIINHAAAGGFCQTIRVPRLRVQRTIQPFADLAWIEAFAAAAMSIFPPIPDGEKNRHRQSAGPRLAALAWFMFLAGARVGSMTSLDWTDVDLAGATAILRKPKGQSDQVVHLPPPLVAALANLAERRGKVFRWQDRRSVYAPWRRVCAKAGLPYIPPHRAGRHGFATGLLRQGVDPVTVAKLGGWSTPRHVYETYGHALEDATLTERLLRKG